MELSYGRSSSSSIASAWSAAPEAYLAELYVVPKHRGQGYGRELITEFIHTARHRGADYAFVITSEEDQLAQRLYVAAGFRRTEGDGGPVMLAYERERDQRIKDQELEEREERLRRQKFDRDYGAIMTAAKKEAKRLGVPVTLKDDR